MTNKYAKVPISRDLEDIFICAVRYCLGRETYMPGLVTDYLKPLLPRLSRRAIDVMERDVVEQEKWGYGAACDKVTWMSFLDALREVKEHDDSK